MPLYETLKTILTDYPRAKNEPLAGHPLGAHPMPFGREARRKPPFPSDPNYDAKAWEVATARKGSGRVVFWNVTGSAD
jgi:hypothetical protein